MTRALLATLEQLQEVLKDPSLHVEAMLDDNQDIFYAIRPMKGKPSLSSMIIVPEGLFEKAHKNGVLIDSKDFCSCYDLGPLA